MPMLMAWRPDGLQLSGDEAAQKLSDLLLHALSLALDLQHGRAADRGHELHRPALPAPVCGADALQDHFAVGSAGASGARPPPGVRP
jgi:hypothetical protein